MTDFFSGLTEALLRRYPDKGVSKEQITGALKTALEPEALINALAEVFRSSPGEMEAALEENGLGEMIARRRMSSGGGSTGGETSAPFCGKKGCLRKSAIGICSWSRPDGLHRLRKDKERGPAA